MRLTTIKTGSIGNCYVLTNDAGKHLILDAGIPIDEIKQGIDYDIENVVGAIVSHQHNDHSMSVNKLKSMGIPVWQPYLDESHLRLKTKIADYSIQSFYLPHNGCSNRGFLIDVDGTRILYATDFEYVGWNLSNQKINIALVEMNYQADRINTLNNHREHVVLGHAEEKTTIDFLSTIKSNLRKVILCHMSMSGALDRPLAIERIREVIPEYIGVQFAIPGESIDISECPF